MAIDDAQWADEESVAFLRFLALRLAGMPAAVLVAARPPAPDDPLAGLLADPAVDVARPRALGLAGTARYLREGARPRAEPRVRTAACHAVTGGNPFLIAQVAHTLRAEGVEPTAEPAPHVAELRPTVSPAS